MLEFDRFTQEFRVVMAESFLKRFGGELTLKVLVCIRIAERRMTNFAEQLEQAKNEMIKESLLVTNDEWEIIQMTK